MSKLSNKLKREISLVCYANVSGLFAYFTNEAHRGPNFSWDWFIGYCVDNADSWMLLHIAKGNKHHVADQAREYTREIANTLVDRMNGR